MSEADLLEELRSIAIEKARAAFDCAACGVETNIIDRTADTIEALITERDAALARAEKAEAEVARLRQKIKSAHLNFIEAWGSLSEGFYTASNIERWLREIMGPAVDRARAALNKEGD